MKLAGEFLPPSWRSSRTPSRERRSLGVGAGSGALAALCGSGGGGLPRLLAPDAPGAAESPHLRGGGGAGAGFAFFGLAANDCGMERPGGAVKFQINRREYDALTEGRITMGEIAIIIERGLHLGLGDVTFELAPDDEVKRAEAELFR